MTQIIDGWLAPNIPPTSRAGTFKLTMGPGDLVIPVVFPDYRVRLPFQTGARDPVRVGIGHAGVVLIEGSRGIAAYYEWGRYDTGRDFGRVRERHVSPTSLTPICRVRVSHLKRILSMLCGVAGDRTRVEAVIVPCPPGGRDRGRHYAESVQRTFARGSEPPGVACAAPGICIQSPFVAPHERIYALTDNNCLSFAVEVAERASGLRLAHEGRTRGPDIPAGWADGVRWTHGLTRIDYHPGDADITVDP